MSKRRNKPNYPLHRPNSHTPAAMFASLTPEQLEDQERKRTLDDLGTANKVFLNQPNHLMLATHLAHHPKSPICSPLQNLRLLEEQYGFQFRQEFWSMRNKRRIYAENHDCRIVISGYWKEIEFRGIGEADFAVLANEVAAMDVCKIIESRLAIDLPTCSIATDLMVRPVVVGVLNQYAKNDWFKPSQYLEGIEANVPVHRRHKCSISVGNEIQQAEAYCSEIARFLAATKFVQKQPDLLEEVQYFTRESLLSDDDYIHLQTRDLDLIKVPLPHEKLIPKDLEKRLEQAEEIVSALRGEEKCFQQQDTHVPDSALNEYSHPGTSSGLSDSGNDTDELSIPANYDDQHESVNKADSAEDGETFVEAKEDIEIEPPLGSVGHTGEEQKEVIVDSDSSKNSHTVVPGSEDEVGGPSSLRNLASSVLDKPFFVDGKEKSSRLSTNINQKESKYFNLMLGGFLFLCCFAIHLLFLYFWD